MCSTLNDIRCSRVVSDYCPNITSDESDFTTFRDGLYSVVRHIPKHNVLIIVCNINAKISKDKKETKHKFCYNFDYLQW